MFTQDDIDTAVNHYNKGRDHFISLGEHLEKVKSKCGRGEFDKYCQQLPFTYQHANRLIFAAKQIEYKNGTAGIDKVCAAKVERSRSSSESSEQVTPTKVERSRSSLKDNNSIPFVDDAAIDAKYEKLKERVYGPSTAEVILDIFSNPETKMALQQPINKEDAYLTIGKLLYTYNQEALTKAVLKVMKQRIHPDKGDGDEALFKFISMIEEVLNV